MDQFAALAKGDYCSKHKDFYVSGMKCETCLKEEEWVAMFQTSDSPSLSCIIWRCTLITILVFGFVYLLYT
jgi:hypothetical protein